MSSVSGPTWRRLKSCLEYKFRDINVPAVSHEDRVKQLGLLTGLKVGDESVLEDESQQLELGQAAGVDASDTELAERVHELAKAVPLENYVHA